MSLVELNKKLELDMTSREPGQAYLEKRLYYSALSLNPYLHQIGHQDQTSLCRLTDTRELPSSIKESPY